MSGIVLSASVRQNLLSLQSTADLLATTQNRLATGKKVNTALDNPTNFFTAQSLDSRAGDINNLLDGIGNGVQVLQQANNGITSLQKLVDTAKSLANQALQSAVGYSTKSNVSATIAGATATDLRGTTTYTSATALSNVLFDGTAGGVTAATGTTDARWHGGNQGWVERYRQFGSGYYGRHHHLWRDRLLEHRGRHAIRRRQELYRQWQNHQLQGGCGADGGDCTGRLWRSRQHRERRQWQLDRLSRGDPGHLDCDGRRHPERDRYRQRRQERRCVGGCGDDYRERRPDSRCNQRRWRDHAHHLDRR